MNLHDSPNDALARASRPSLSLPAAGALRWLRFAVLNTLDGSRTELGLEGM